MINQELPIYELLKDIKSSLKDNKVVILQAAPGAGKSTVLPLKLLYETWLAGKKILMLEPRRLATKTVAIRMASLLNEQVGETVGYKVRFENVTSAKTKIEVVTEGILTRLIQQDNMLEGVGLVIFDEFHERSLQADLSLALTREIQQILREDLKILIMSATIDGDKLAKLLDNAPILTSKGRQFPITYFYQPQSDQPLPQRIVTSIKQAYREQDGDILVFLPGAGEIQNTIELLNNERLGLEIYPLYGDLPQKAQQEAITPHPLGKRKVVLATSIAETSLTIEGVKVVIDSGLSRSPKYDLRTGLTTLATYQVSLDVADQRAGRAGRLGPGVCYRMWALGQHQYLELHRTPEILEADLSTLVLNLAIWGVQDVKQLAWLTIPPTSAVNQAKELLNLIGALENNKITAIGKQIVNLPTHPRIGYMFLEAKKINLLGLACDLAAIIEERDPLVKENQANLAYRLEALNKWRTKEYTNADKNILSRIEKLSNSWISIFKCKPHIEGFTYQQVGQLIAFAYPERIAKRISKGGNKYRLSNGKVAIINEQDHLLTEEWLAIAHMDAGKNEGKIFNAVPINIQDFTSRFQTKEVVDWDYQKGQFIARKETILGNLTIESTAITNISESLKADVLCKVFVKEGFSVFNLTDDIAQWQNRIQSLSIWTNDASWPKVDEESLKSNVQNWLPPYLMGINRLDDFKKLNLLEILESLLTYEQSILLAKLAPQAIEVPTGSKIKLEYKSDGSFPVLAVRLQEVFGLVDTPAINNGQVKILLHLLSPGYKPVQVTQDLKSFWKNTYPEVRKELKVRYQRHAWPEDPWTAEAVKGPRKRQP